MKTMTANRMRWLLLFCWALYVVSWRAWIAGSRHPDVMMAVFQLTLVPSILFSVMVLWALKGR